MIRLARITGSTAFSRTVNSNCKFFSQNSEETNMNFDNAKLAQDLKSESVYFEGLEQTVINKEASEPRRHSVERISFSHTFLINSASASSASAPTHPISSSSAAVL